MFRISTKAIGIGLLIIVSMWTLGLLYSYFDNQAAINTVLKRTDIKTFSPDEDYLRIANQIDGFALPVYYWSTKSWFFRGGLPRLSKTPVMKAVLFDANLAPHVVFLTSDEWKMSVVSRLTKGSFLSAHVYTGAQRDLSEEIIVNKGIEFAQTKAKGVISYTSFQLNRNQVDIYKDSPLVVVAFFKDGVQLDK